MTGALLPINGSWYRDLDGPPYEVIDVREDEGFVAGQFVDGTIEEYDLDEWCDGYMKGEIVKVEPPEGW